MAFASTTSAHPLAHYRAEFPIFERQIYLNSCSLGALSTRSRRQVGRFLELWESRGAAAWYDVWWEALAELRQGYAQVVGANPGEIALHASISTATAVLSGALDYAARPKVVTTALDFPTVAYQWLAKQPSGVEVEVVESPDGITVPLDTLERAIDRRTALVATSHVYFTSGAIQDVRAVADLAHAKGALCFIDAYQSVGQVPVNVHATGVDFLCAGGLKWLLGGPGTVFLYVREDLIRQLTPTVTGWFAHQRQFDFDPRGIVWHDDARRFEQGTPALAAVYAQLGGLEVIREIGVPRIREIVRELTEDLITRALGAGLHPKVAADPSQRSAIVMIPDDNPAGSVRRLADASIVADARPGHVRLSPFFYNLSDDHAAAIEVLRA
ncbi:MAG: aminotransferase class V-fold PLP-dependent enzyme [Gemmatimonadales bacterium]|nr:aminotransferase class V-fold PLP-dependent enzyme [Gemmatimonadales bacterium]NIN10399.1 aminotransferase class V-fold PLP-dependent enzyme [Gemmatimonadales bacterium]NIN49191.1 aminotransferase class V-fold PLP-dependent enzyme [Gemmatimonadales bacterium]NIP06655.1 aminotransferase class V-fold PLP-dependent enzyme [Gemmatimonadales bacterium]NIQ99985.1 aminotransferase class V-fold PLP-dependent enzyme [Gemmatimonadales bacterium]